MSAVWEVTKFVLGVIFWLEVLIMLVRVGVPIWVIDLGLALLFTVALIFDALNREYIAVSVDAFFAVAFWRRFWKRRPKGKGRKAAKLVGAKAKAILDKVKASMPKPSSVRIPSLSPVPGAA